MNTPQLAPRIAPGRRSRGPGTHTAHLALAAVLALCVVSAGCLRSAPGGQRQPTPFEQALAITAQLLIINEQLADAVMEADQQGLIASALADDILEVQFRVADFGKQLTEILREGKDHARLNAADISALLAKIEAEAQGLVDRGTLGISNQTTQREVMTRIGTVFTLARQLTSLLALAGVL